MASVEGIIEGIFEDTKQFGQDLNMYDDIDRAIFDVFIWALNGNGLLEDYVRNVVDETGIGGPYEYFRNTGYLAEFLGNYENGLIPAETISALIKTHLAYLPDWPVFEELSEYENVEEDEGDEDFNWAEFFEEEDLNDNLAFEP